MGPVLRPDVPGEPGGDVVGRAARGPGHRPQGLPRPKPVVGAEGVDPGDQGGAVPVAGKGQLHRVVFDLVQALEVVPQGVFQVGPHGDVGGDIKQDVVRREQNAPLFLPQADLPRGVAGGLDDLQSAVPHGEHVPVGEGDAGEALQVGAQGPGGVGLQEDPGLGGGEALPGEALVGEGPEIGIVGPEGHGVVPRPDVDGPPRGDEVQALAGVVGVDVGAEDIQPGPVRPGLGQPLLDGPPAGGQAEARVDEQGPVRPPDEVGVELLQGVVRQGDGDAVDVPGDLLDHWGTLLSGKTEQAPPRPERRERQGPFSFLFGNRISQRPAPDSRWRSPRTAAGGRSRTT